jgi:membrane protease YdiL (CAAX protease family)
VKVECKDTKATSDVSGPGLGAVIVLTLLYLVLAGLAGKLMVSLNKHGGPDVTTSLLISQFIAWPPVLWIGARWARETWGSCFALRKFSASMVIPVILVSAGGAVLLTEVLSWLPRPAGMVRTLGGTLGGNRVAGFVLIVLVGPIAEELFFRGWMLRCFLRRHSVRKSTLISAGVFAVYHVEPALVLIILPLGILFAWLATTTGSLLPSMLSHAVCNAIVVFVLPLVLELPGFDAQSTHYPFLVLAVAAVLAATGGTILYRGFAGRQSS